MDFPFQKCIFTGGSITAVQACRLLQYPHAMGVMLFDLKCLAAEALVLGEAKLVSRYLSSQEQAHFSRITSDKRKRDWLGGRFAARHAAAEVLVCPEDQLQWKDLAILPDENGRPYVAAADSSFPILPDVSISHSGDLAAAMAVSQGLCGLDIQRVTGRVIKVQERFCKPAEEKLLQTCCQDKTAALTMLWAAKEALRKVANSSSLPGFLELELQEVTIAPSGPWRFTVKWSRTDDKNGPEDQICRVVISSLADYVLALTISNMTVD